MGGRGVLLGWVWRQLDAIDTCHAGRKYDILTLEGSGFHVWLESGMLVGCSSDRLLNPWRDPALSHMSTSVFVGVGPIFAI